MRHKDTFAQVYAIGFRRKTTLIHDIENFHGAGRSWPGLVTQERILKNAKY